MEVETIGSLMEQCEELTQYIVSERDRLERFMLETGGESDASDRIQMNIDSAEDSLAEAEKRLQALFDAQEKEAFAPKEKAMNENRNTGKRASCHSSNYLEPFSSVYLDVLSGSDSVLVRLNGGYSA